MTSSWHRSCNISRPALVTQGLITSCYAGHAIAAASRGGPYIREVPGDQDGQLRGIQGRGALHRISRHRPKAAAAA